MKEKFIGAYMDTAFRFAELSSAVRLKVGSLIVKDDRIISIGYNGTPTGWDNNCEHSTETLTGTVLKTKDEVIHAEMNALMKLAKSTESGDCATIFITHAPCIDCAKAVYQAGISTVYYVHDYKSTTGIDFLNKCDGIEIHKVEMGIMAHE
jgi:dCMP deaminase